MDFDYSCERAALAREFVNNHKHLRRDPANELTDPLRSILHYAERYNTDFEEALKKARQAFADDMEGRQ